MELDELNEKTTELIRKHDEALILAIHYEEKREQFQKEIEELRKKARAEGFEYDMESEELKWKKKESK